MRCFAIILICFAFGYSIDCASVGKDVSESSESEELMEKLCEKMRGNPASFQDFFRTKVQFAAACALSDLKNMTKEIKKAQEDGVELQPVVHKYCARRDAVYKCFQDLFNAYKQCFTEEQHSASDRFDNITKAVFDIACEQDGAELIRFNDNEGSKCGEEQKAELEECANNIKMSISSWESGADATVVPVDKWCNMTQTFGDCVTSQFEKCSASVPGEVVSGFFKNVRSQSVCAEYKTEPTGTPENNQL